MPTTRYYKSRQHSVADFIVDFTRWLVDDHPSRRGPRWELVEARDQTAGTPRQVPTQSRGQGTFSSLPSGFSWREGNILVGDWAVFRSVTRRGNDEFGPIEFQLYVSFETATNMGLLLIPMNDFVVGGGDASPPTFPSTAFGSGATSGTRVQMTAFNAPGDYYAVADEGMFALVMDNGTPGGLRFTYFGECDSPAPPDTRPYVTWNNTSQVNFPTSTNNILTRLSPLDNSTILANGSACFYRERTSNVSPNADLSHRPNVRPLPTGPFFSTSGHRHLVGYFRNCFMGPNRASLRGEMRGREYIYFNNVFTTTLSASIMLKWDSVTGVT